LLQRKEYESSNCIYFEKYSRKGRSDCGHYEVPLFLYYVSQEVDFYLWCDMQVMKKLSIYKNTIFKRIIQDACLFALSSPQFLSKEIWKIIACYGFELNKKRHIEMI